MPLNVMVMTTLKKMVIQQTRRISTPLSTRNVSTSTKSPTANLHLLDECLNDISIMSEFVKMYALCTIANAPPLPPAYVPDAHEYQNLNSQQVCTIPATFICMLTF